MATPNPASTPRADQERLWFNNPVRFTDVGLGVKPWRKQEEILNAIARYNYVAVRSCNGSGKTFTAALATLWWLMTREEAIVITTRAHGTPSQERAVARDPQDLRPEPRTDRRQHLADQTRDLQRPLRVRVLHQHRREIPRFPSRKHPHHRRRSRGRSRIRIRRDLGIHDHPKRQDAHDRQPRRTRRHVLRRLPQGPGTMAHASTSQRSTPPAFTDETPSDEPLPTGIPTPEWVERIQRQRGEHSAAYQTRDPRRLPVRRRTTRSYRSNSSKKP